MSGRGAARRAAGGGVPVEFHKSAGGRYHSVLQRADGVSVRLEGGSYNRIGGAVERVPHDIAHLVVEDAFALRAGLWGVLADGGTVQNASVVAGRRPPHAERRATEIAQRAAESLRQAEILVRAVADATLEPSGGDIPAFRARVGDRWWSPSITADALAVACTRLREAAVRWDAVPEGSVLVLRWSPGTSAPLQRRATARPGRHGS